ncbi:MAG: hypothetical protein Q4E75_01615 [bacterium]|nr:hypothetical protein [bacterium]
MSIKDKLFNKIVDFVNKYKSPEYDRVNNLSINGYSKSVIATPDGNYLKPISDKNQDEFINFDNLLESELGNCKYGSISFCEDGNVICIYNADKDRYVKLNNELFDTGKELTYITCGSKSNFDSCRDFINQSSKYHKFLEDVEEIPYKDVFNKCFNIKQKEQADVVKILEEKEEQEIELNKNYVQIDGNLKKIGKEFTKKDGLKAEFIELEQNYEYNGKVKKNIISVMLEGNVFNEFASKINEGDKVGITGQLSSYTDRNKQSQSVINCYDLEILNRNMDREAQR